MQDRIDRNAFYALQPELPKALIRLGQLGVEAGLEKTLVELVKIRASQLNGCAFCLHMHLADARKYGEDQERLDVLAAWKEVPCFSERERAALTWTEALTQVAEDGVSDDVFSQVRAQFNDAELAGLTSAIVAINGWNRIAVGFQFSPDVKQLQAAE